MGRSQLHATLSLKSVAHLLVVFVATSVGAFWLWDAASLQCAQVPPTVTEPGYDVCGREWSVGQGAAFVTLLVISVAMSVAIIVRAVRATRARSESSTGSGNP